ncbi:FMRFamide receptor [Plakobranchus ocellatus]|uniref:FMRFamide receptor n=1 Tax=Plakobranchus ocellatus TaxID=259542 RepID=A0AAV3Y141_9GAST|nr:FMRFamide receptor [Plakobranchus ocellatus]
MATTAETASSSDMVSDLLPTTMSPGDLGMKLMTEKSSLPDELNYIMSAVVGPIICFIGMAGNVLSIITWSRPKMRSSTGRYLTAQAVADFAVLLFFILVDSLQVWHPDAKYNIVYGLFFCYIGYPGIFFAVVCSIWYTVGVTVDRYILVCWITKAKQFCNEKRANFGLFLITFNAFVINFPHYMSFSPVFPKEGSSDHVTGRMEDNRTAHTNNSNPGMDVNTEKMMERVVTFEMTEFTKGASGQFYEFWIHCMILILIPWATVFFMNIMIIRAVSRSNKKNADKKTTQSAKNSKDSENQITRLLLTVTFTFLFFIGAQCVIQCMYMKKPAGFNMFLVNSSFAIAKCGIVFNSSLNFFLYCLTGRRFRVELLRILGMGRPERQMMSSLMDRPSGSSSRRTTSSTGNTGI